MSGYGPRPPKNPREAYVAPENLAARARAWLAPLKNSRGRRVPWSLERAGLVVLDAQRIFCDPESPAFLPAWPAVAPNVHRLIHAFLRAGRPVALTRHVHPADETDSVLGHFFGRVLRDDDPLAALLPEFAPALAAGAVEHVKSLHAAFGHALPPALADCRLLVLAGVQTPLCVLSTALDLPRFGMAPLVVADATAAAAEAEHVAALRALALAHAHLATTDEALARLEGES